MSCEWELPAAVSGQEVRKWQAVKPSLCGTPAGLWSRPARKPGVLQSHGFDRECQDLGADRQAWCGRPLCGTCTWAPTWATSQSPSRAACRCTACWRCASRRTGAPGMPQNGRVRALTLNPRRVHTRQGVSDVASSLPAHDQFLAKSVRVARWRCASCSGAPLLCSAMSLVLNGHSLLPRCSMAAHACTALVRRARLFDEPFHSIAHLHLNSVRNGFARYTACRLFVSILYAVICIHSLIQTCTEVCRWVPGQCGSPGHCRACMQ